MAKKQQVSKVSGRQRLEWPVIEGIAAAAAQIGCPVALIKSVKKTDSSAFMTGNRVDTKLLLPALFRALATKSVLPDGVTSPQDWAALEKARILAQEREKSAKLLMPTAESIRQANAAGALFMTTLEKWCRELPPALAGETAVNIAVRMEAEKDKTWIELNAKLGEIGK